MAAGGIPDGGIHLRHAETKSQRKRKKRRQRNVVNGTGDEARGGHAAAERGVRQSGGTQEFRAIVGKPEFRLQAQRDREPVAYRRGKSSIVAEVQPGPPRSGGRRQ